MSYAGDPNTENHTRKKPPRRHWQAVDPFVDLKASHLVEIALTIALLFVGISQLCVYKRQAKTMGDQTGIMKAQAQISSGQLVAQEQAAEAFVYPTNFTMTEQDGILSVRPFWKNSGTTQTRNLVFGISDSPLKEIPDHFQFSGSTYTIGQPPVNLKISILLGPSSTVGSPLSVAIPIYSVPAINAGKYAAFVWGWAEYEDVFTTTKHVTRFCREIDHIDSNVAPDGTVSFFSYPCIRGNCADDECKAQGIPPPT